MCNPDDRTGRRSARGFTLVELLVALSVGLFLVGGMLMVLQQDSRAFNGQSSLAQLQDNERLTMSLLADVVESSGYFPDPTVSTAVGSLPVAPGFATAGQSVFGTSGANPPGDSLTVRYATASGDGVLNCSGTANNSGANVVFVNTFFVAAGQLQCTMNGTPFVLASGVQGMTVQYGVRTNAAVTSGNVDTYKTAAQMTAADWNNAVSVVVTVTFVNPLYVAGQAPPQFLPFRRVITLMNMTGIRL